MFTPNNDWYNRPWIYLSTLESWYQFLTNSLLRQKRQGGRSWLDMKFVSWLMMNSEPSKFWMCNVQHSRDEASDNRCMYLLSSKFTQSKTYGREALFKEWETNWATAIFKKPTCLITSSRLISCIPRNISKRSISEINVSHSRFMNVDDSIKSGWFCIAGFGGHSPTQRLYYSLDLKIRGACVSMVAVPTPDTICVRKRPQSWLVGVLGTVIGLYLKA